MHLICTIFTYVRVSDHTGERAGHMRALNGQQHLLSSGLSAHTLYLNK